MRGRHPPTTHQTERPTDRPTNPSTHANTRTCITCSESSVKVKPAKVPSSAGVAPKRGPAWLPAAPRWAAWACFVVGWCWFWCWLVTCVSCLCGLDRGCEAVRGLPTVHQNNTGAPRTLYAPGASHWRGASPPAPRGSSPCHRTPPGPPALCDRAPRRAAAGARTLSGRWRPKGRRWAWM